jgi:hypothetical protein
LEWNLFDIVCLLGLIGDESTDAPTKATTMPWNFMNEFFLVRNAEEVILCLKVESFYLSCYIFFTGDREEDWE